MAACPTIVRALLLTVILGTGVALSKQDPGGFDKTINFAVNNRDGVAIHGYDPVAYFDDLEAVPGEPGIETVWAGTRWRFSSERNRARFLDDPRRYAPQYGGFEAYGVALGKAYDVDPTVFDVIDGKLYLHRNDRVRELWQRNPGGYIAEADAAWRDRGAEASP